ncbi:MAG: glutamate--tRNA ligase [Elusimicrobia bacterium GWA2_69_24]|nr:MAG: glutamate--tRNA ligase [Elusimicrobia bacterium GWA2_69_24]
MNDKIRVRFAPSPTGYLHIGGARTALFNWLYARGQQGTFILRIEDTDELRSTPDSVEAILGSMRWLGLDWDEGPAELGPDGRYLTKGDSGPYFQMERQELYRKHVDALVAEGKAYRCYCTKEELDAARAEAQAAKRLPRYSGRCRSLSDAQGQAFAAEGRRPSVRLRMPDDGATVVPDRIRGEVSFENAVLQDFVIQKMTGGPTYNFACVIDDHAMRISHVIRGDEHLSNTPLQLRLYEALGWAPPIFAHLSMILGPDGTKLSKRHGATSVLEYRSQGFLPDAMRNYLALLGWSNPESQQLFDGDELFQKFSVEGCQKNPATFDPVKLQWMNGEYIRKRTGEQLFADALPFLEQAGFGDVARADMLPTVALEREKYKLLTDVPGRVDYFFRDVVYQPEAVEKVLRKEGVDGILGGLAGILEASAAFDAKTLEERIRGFCSEKGLKPNKVFHPIRVAVSGRTDGATLFGMLELLGREKVLARIRTARQLLKP